MNSSDVSSFSASSSSTETDRPVRHASNGLEDYIAVSRYARYDEAKRRRETWAEAVARVRDMHLGHYAETSLEEVATGALRAGEIEADIIAKLGPLDSLHGAVRSAFSAVEGKRVLPSMRSLQFGGDAILQKNTRVFNCAFLHIDRLESFRETLYLLLCGCGVGFSVQTQHIAKLPALAPAPTGEVAAEPHVIADTIEGWADAMHALMEAAVAGRRLAFDYSEIRSAGAPLRTRVAKLRDPSR